MAGMTVGSLYFALHYRWLYSTLWDEAQCLLGTFLTIAGAVLMASVIFYYDYMGAITHNQQYYHNSFSNIAGQFSSAIVLMVTGIILLLRTLIWGKIE